MAIVLLEKHDSREWIVDESATIVYTAWNDDLADAVDEPTLRAQVAATAPTTYQGLRRLDQFEIRQSENIATVRVSYKKFEADWRVTLSTSGGSFTRKYSLSTIASYPAPGVAAAPDFKGLINVDGDRVLGVEEQVRGFSFVLTRYVSDAIVNGFIQDLYEKTTHVNNADVSFTYRGWSPTFKPGELLCLNGDGAPREAENGDWEFTINFSAERNVVGEVVPGIGAIDKQGQDYFWIRHVDDDDAVAGVSVRIPEAGYVERTKARADLTTLFI